MYVYRTRTVSNRMNVLESILLLAAGVAGVMALAPAETASDSSDQPQKVNE